MCWDWRWIKAANAVVKVAAASGTGYPLYWESFVYLWVGEHLRKELQGIIKVMYRGGTCGGVGVGGAQSGLRMAGCVRLRQCTPADMQMVWSRTMPDLVRERRTLGRGGERVRVCRYWSLRRRRRESLQPFLSLSHSASLLTIPLRHYPRPPQPATVKFRSPAAAGHSDQGRLVARASYCPTERPPQPTLLHLTEVRSSLLQW